MTIEQESDLLITSMITNRIGQQEVLLPYNHNHLNFEKKKREKSMQIKFRHEINVVYYENGA